MSDFERETRVERVSEGRFRGRLSPRWNIHRNPNGGYLLSLITRALGAVMPHPDPISLTAHYLRPGIAEADCDIRVELLRAGRTLATARASLWQDGALRIEALAAYGDLTQEGSLAAVVEPPMPVIPAPEYCVPRSGGAQGVELAISDRLDLRLQPDLAGARTAEVSGWIRLADGTAPDVRSLALFSDGFPPSVFPVLGLVGWVPTIELTVHVRRRPAPGWVLGRFVTDDLLGGRMVESGTLWDARGQLVARGRQIGLVLPAVEGAGAGAAS